jgi:hypothetical protein
MEFQTLIPVINTIFAIACAFVADRRGGAPLVWFVFGYILGPLAFAAAITGGKKCKFCNSGISKEAAVCRYCAREQ